MNLKSLFLSALVCCYLLTSCTEADNENVTLQISKVETLYEEGQSKALSMVPKEESKSSEEYIDNLFRNELEQDISRIMTNRTSGRVAAFGDYDIGLVGFNYINCQGTYQKIDFHMDTEDNNSTTSVTQVITPRVSTPWGIPYRKGRPDIDMSFCVVNGQTYSQYRYSNSHLVLRIGALAVFPGTQSVVRRFDNEDDNNENSPRGSLGGDNFMDGNTRLYFTYFPAVTKSDSQLGAYRAMGAISASNEGPVDWSLTGLWRYNIDDEDRRNANYWVIDGVKVSSWNNVNMSGGSNTVMYVTMF